MRQIPKSIGRVSTVYVDMDEVFVDFVGGALKAHNISKEELRAARNNYMETEGEFCWSLQTLLGMTEQEFWKPVNAQGIGFWENLEPLPWCKTLFNLLNERLPDNWYVATSPGCSFYEGYYLSIHCESSYAGKIRWMAKHFGHSFNKYIITPHKSLLARPGAVLIDDRPVSCTKFEIANEDAAAVVFPTEAATDDLDLVANPLRDEYIKQVIMERYL